MAATERRATDARHAVGNGDARQRVTTIECLAIYGCHGVGHTFIFHTCGDDDVAVISSRRPPVCHFGLFRLRNQVVIDAVDFDICMCRDADEKQKNTQKTLFCFHNLHISIISLYSNT